MYISYGSPTLSLTCVVFAICDIDDINYQWTVYLWFCTPPLNASRLKNYFFCCWCCWDENHLLLNSILFYSLQPPSQVWILIIRNWPIFSLLFVFLSLKFPYGWVSNPTPRSETTRLRSSVFKFFDKVGIFLVEWILTMFSMVAV